MNTQQATKPAQAIEPHAVNRLLAEGRARLIDVREPEERSRILIAGSLSMPLSSFDARSVPVDQGIMPIFHCRRGGRSAKALEQFCAGSSAGAAHMTGGIESWKPAGLPVVERAGISLTPMQQTQILMGAVVLLGTALALLWSPWALALTTIVGSGMVYAGATGSCALASLLEKAPWNRSSPSGPACKV